MNNTNVEKYIPGAGIAAGSLMLKWQLLDQLTSELDTKLEAGDTVNVFINLECVLRNLSMQRGLTAAVNFHKQRLVIEIESSILNLIANYRMYFKKLKCNPKLYFYYTDLKSENQQMAIYNKYYRTFYQNRYMQNPQFRSVGELLNNTILPEVTLILQYVPNCYVLKSTNFDSSLIPQIVSTFSDAKNIIISGDVFDTLYMFNPIFGVIYIKRRFGNFSVMNNIPQTIASIIKNESVLDLDIFNSELYYRLLLSIKGSKIRNIRSAKGFGYGKFISLLKMGMNDGVVLKDFSSIDSIIQLFPATYREDIKNAFQCTSLDLQYNLLTDSDFDNIHSQIIDKVDINSIEALNNRRFLEFPINLQGLIY